MRITGIPAEIVNLLFFGFYHAYTLITSGTVFGGKVNGFCRKKIIRGVDENRQIHIIALQQALLLMKNLI